MPSILFARPGSGAGDDRTAPEFFRDLHLDQVVDDVTAAYGEYALAPYFYTPLMSVDEIRYRHEVFQDLQTPALWTLIQRFAEQMRAVRTHLTQAEKLHYRYQREAWFLDAVRIYTEAVAALRAGLAGLTLGSRGFRAVRAYLEEYLASDVFRDLADDAAQVRAGLAGMTYCLRIEGSRITVSRYDGEADYAAEVEQTFERFKRAAGKDYRTDFRSPPEMNHVEAGVLDLVAGLYPDAFRALDTFADRHRDFMDGTVAAFDREVQFYVAYLEFVRRVSAAGLRFCYPRVSERSKEIAATETFDVALAVRLASRQGVVVCNDFFLTDPERILIVTGPNQGGKTTFARTVGQIHYLASLGCLVPGSEARVFLPDALFTHFEREETLSDLHGELQDDLVRMHNILERATPRSLLILNEVFTSATFRDALFLSRQVLEQIVHLDLLCVCVTFLDELTTLSRTAVSMVSNVVPENPSLRTYKILRRPADGRAYAVAIAEKYGLTPARLGERLRERLAP